MNFRVGVGKGLDPSNSCGVVYDASGNRIGKVTKYFEEGKGNLYADVELDPDVEKPESDLLWYTSQKQSPFPSIR